MKILIIHTAFIGDIVLSTPMIAKIADEYPNAKITYLTVPSGAAILKNNPKLSHIFIYDKKGKQKSWKAFWKLAMNLRQEKFDLVFCPHRYLRSMLLTLLTGAPQKIGYAEAPFAWTLTKKIRYQKGIHEVERLLSFVSSTKKNEKHYEVELYPSEDDKKLWKTLQESLDLSQKTVVLAPGSRWKTKQWPLEYFQKVIQAIQFESNIILIGGAEERELFLQLERGIDLRGKTSLLELTAILQNADYIVTNDSSPIHIASSSERGKIIALFGPTVRSFGFTPWSKNHVLLEEDLPCRPCGLHGGNECPEKHFRCMRDLRPERVIKEIKSKN